MKNPIGMSDFGFTLSTNGVFGSCLITCLIDKILFRFTHNDDMSSHTSLRCYPRSNHPFAYHCDDISLLVIMLLGVSKETSNPSRRQNASLWFIHCFLEFHHVILNIRVFGQWIFTYLDWLACFLLYYSNCQNEPLACSIGVFGPRFIRALWFVRSWLYVPLVYALEFQFILPTAWTYHIKYKYLH